MIRVLIVLLISTPAVAADDVEKLIKDHQSRSSRSAMEMVSAPAGDFEQFDLPVCDKKDRLCMAVTDAKIASYEYNAAAHRYNIKMFERHQIWTEVAGYFVYALTLFGVILSALEFIGFNARRRSANEQVHSAKLAGIFEITSPVLGLLILTISLGFFTIYVRDVYTIKNIAQSEQ